MCPRCKSPYWEVPKIRVPVGGGGLGVEQVLGPYRKRIMEIAAAHHAHEIRVFGSVARGSGSPASDVDFLVDFDRKRRAKSTLRTLDLARELEELLGRHVDVATEEDLHWFVQPQIVTEAVPL